MIYIIPRRIFSNNVAWSLSNMKIRNRKERTMLRRKLLQGFLGILAISVAGMGWGIQSALANDGIFEIKKRGVLRAGTKADKRPFGFRDSSGKIVGMDPDFVQDLASRLGVKLEIVPVTTSNRMQFLQQGKVDVFSANMSDTATRRKVVGVVLPNPYSIGMGVLSPKKSGFKKWEDMRGQKACTLQGAWYIKMIDQKYGIKSVTFKGSTEAFAAFEDRRCDLRIGDDVELHMRKEDLKDRYKDFEMTVPSIGYVPLGVSVSLDQKDKAWGRFVAGVLTEWHQTGRFIATWKKWGLGTSGWLEEMHEKFKDPLAAKK